MFEGAIQDEVNVVFARIDDQIWLRFFFDVGVFFWREVSDPDPPPKDRTHEWLLVSVVLPNNSNPRRVTRVSFTSIPGEPSRALTISLLDGTTIELRSHLENNSLVVRADGRRSDSLTSSVRT